MNVRQTPSRMEINDILGFCLMHVRRSSSIGIGICVINYSVAFAGIRLSDLLGDVVAVDVVALSLADQLTVVHLHSLD